MFNTYTFESTPTLQKSSVKPNFVLLPQNQVPPIITQQPTNGLTQTSHKDGSGNYTTMVSVNGTTTALLGTNFTASLQVIDPSNVLDPSNLENLKIVWKFNGAELHEYTQQNNGKGTTSISFVNATPLINGDYIAEITNDYGTTTSDTLTVQIVDPNNNKYINSNLVQNSLGAAGLDGWEASNDIQVNQLDDTYTGTNGFASIVNNNLIDPLYDENDKFVKGKDRYAGEWPFKFSTAANITDFRVVWDSIKNNKQLGNTEDLKNYPTTLITNEKPSGSYGEMYPSPYNIDAYNGLVKPKRGLVSDLATIPTYFTRDKIKFSSQQTSTLTQTIDITELGDVVDGNAVGIDELSAQFFCYLGAGISKYNYELLDKFGNVVRTLNTYIVSPIMWSRFLANDPEFVKTIIPDNVVKINLVPIIEDITTVQVACFDQNNNRLRNLELQGPTSEDIWSVKQKFFISTYINKLFNLLTTYTKEIPVYIFDKKYFVIEPDISKSLKVGNKSKNENQNWLATNYPKYVGSTSKYSLSQWEDGLFTLKGFDKGAAALFGYSQTFTIPVKTRSIQIRVNFINTSKVRADQSPKTFVNGYNWVYEDIYATHLALKGIYQHNNPRVAATLFKLVLTNERFDKRNAGNYTFPTYFVPDRNVWYDSKATLRTLNMDETLGYTTYVDINGPYAGQFTSTTQYSDIIPTTTNASEFIPTDSNNATAIPTNLNSAGQIVAPVTASSEEIIPPITGSNPPTITAAPMTTSQ